MASSAALERRVDRKMPRRSEFSDRPHLVRRTSERDRHGARGGGRRQDNLSAFSGGKRRGEQRRRLVNPLAGGVRDQLGEPPAPVKVRKGQRAPLPARAGFRRTPRRGRLMQSSVTSGSARIGRRARRLSSSAELESTSWARESTVMALCPVRGTELATRSAYTGRKSTSRATNTWMRDPLGLGDGGRDIDGAAQHLRHDIGGGRGAYHHRSAAVLGVHRALHRPIDDGEQDGGTKSIPEMRVHLAGKTRASEFIRPRGSERHDDACGRPGLRPEHEDPRRPLLHLATGFADELRSALQEHDGSIRTEGVGRGHAGRHARQRRVDRGLERAVDEGALGQQKSTRGEDGGIHRGRHGRTQQRVRSGSPPPSGSRA